MPLHRLSEQDIAACLDSLPGWEREGDKILRRYRFQDFVHAFGWMSSAALVAESLNHHPEWKNVYSTVEVELTTHDVGGLSEGDFRLAEAMEKLAQEHGAGGG